MADFVCSALNNPSTILNSHSQHPPHAAAGMELTILARIPQLMLDRAANAGLDRASLERAAGLAESDLSDPDARVPKTKLIALWKEIIRVVDNPLLGLKLGASVCARDIGLVGYIMAASNTLGNALRSLSRYGAIIADDVKFTLEPRGELVDLDITASVELVALAHPIVSRLSSMIAAAREITEVDLHPAAVSVPQPAPADPAPFREFFRCPVQFGSGSAVLTLRSEDLNLPIPSADQALSHYLENYAQSIISALPQQNTLVSQIWRILMVRLPAGDPGIDTIAVTLGLNARTVQRRLKAEGTNYRELRDSFRKTTAQKLLANPRVPIKEIAFLLGYQDLGAFYRAFRRWQDCSPMDYRRQHMPA
jgi:AraC-like DNA-binding protein